MSPSRLFSYRYWIVLPVLMLLTMSSTFAQIFTVNQPEIKKYPKVSSFFTAQEKVGNEVFDISPLDSTDFDVFENGVKIPTVNVSKRCSTMVDGPSVCVVLVIDKSGSMSEIVDPTTNPPGTRFSFVKDAAKVFIDAVNFLGNSRVAVVSFDGEAYLEQDWTNNRTLLKQKVDDILIGSATKYDPPMLDPRWGAIQMLKDPGCVAPTKRVVIFLTDGFPKPDPTDSLVQKGLDANGIIFYAITAFNGMNPFLQKWADKTGGKAFVADGQDAKSRLVEIYKQIASELQSKQTCYLEWISPMSCDEGGRQRHVDIKLKKTYNITSSTNYVAPPSSVLKIGVSDPVVFFGDPDPPLTVQKTVTVTAKNGKIVLNDGKITSTGAFYKLLPPNDKFPLTIDSGKSITFTMEFTQEAPKSFRQGTFVLSGTPCDPPIISLVGGLSNVVLLGPGEVSTDTSTSCEDILIRWAGIQPEQKVVIQYLDTFGVWQLITDTASGLSYIWPASQIAKLPIGVKYKIKIQIPPTKTFVWVKQIGGVLNDSITSISLSSDGLHSFISGEFEGTGATFGSTILNCAGGSKLDGFVAQLDGSGNFVWATSFGGSGDDRASGVAAGPANTSYITGFFTGDAFFGGQQKLPFNKNVKNFFMARVNSSGQILYVYSETQSNSSITGESYGTDIAYDPSTGLVYVHGMFKGKIKDTGPLAQLLVSSKPTVFEPFSAIFKEDGTFLSISKGTNENQRPYSKLTATDKDGCLYKAENFDGMLTDKSPLLPITSAGKTDGAISKFCGLPASIDTSTFPFVIAKPRLVSVDPNNIVFHFKKTASVGVSLDELISAGICNYGTKSTEILDVIFSNKEFEMSNNIIGRNFYVPNCDTVGLEIRFTPTHAGDTCTEMIIISACSDPLKIIICATAVDRCDFTKKDVDMDSALVGGVRDSIVTSIFCNTSLVQISGKLKLIGANPEDFEIISVDPSYLPTIPDLKGADTTFTLNPGKCLTIKMRFRPHGAGNRSAILQYNLPPGCEVAQSLLNGKGLAPLAIDVEASTWACTRPGAKVTQQLKITNIGTSVATINSVNAGPPPFSLPVAVPSFTLNAGGNKIIDVEFAPVTVGPYNGTLTVNATAASGTKDFSSALKGESCVPVVSLAKNCFDLTAIGSLSNKSDAIVVTNTGNFDLNVTAIKVISGDVGAFNVAPSFQPTKFTVPSGKSQNISGVFSPGTVGNLKAMVEIVSDGIPGHDTIEVCGPAFAADTTIDFGTILLCERPQAGPMFYPNPTGSDLTITVSSDNTNFVVSPKGTIIIPSNGTLIPFNVVFAPTAVGTFSGTVKIGDKNVQVKGIARVTPIDFFAVPLAKDSLKIHPGDITKVTVKADIGASLLNTSLDTMSFTFTYDDQLFTVASTGGIPNTTSLLAGWNWKATQSKGTIIVGGKGPAIVGPATGQSLLSVDFVGYLADKLIYSIAMTSTIPAQLQTCLPTTDKGTVFILDDKICFVAGRLVHTGSSTYQLTQAKPTPAVNQAKFEYGIGLDGNAEIELINTMGEKVMTLINQHHNAGLYEMTLDVNNLPSGVYFYVLRSGPYLEQQKLVITK